MKHLELFEGYSPKGRFPSIAVFLAIPADNDSMKTSYLKKKRKNDVNNSMVHADYVVRGIGSLLSEIEEAGLDARYSGAIKKAKAALMPAVMKTKEYQLPKEIE